MLLERLQRPVRGVRIVRKDPSVSHPGQISAQIIPQRRLTNHEITATLAQLKDVPGRVVTSALSESEQAQFLDAGFEQYEALYLLRHDLRDRPRRSPGRHRMRTGRRGDLSTVLDIDQRSFDEFWAMDRDAFHAAKKATPVHRYQVATINRRVVGYAINGRAGSSSFLQRLGVDLAVRGEGIGSDLVLDAFDWAAANGATSMLVNTQVSNTNARRLYERLGFTLADERLHVLEWKRS